MDYEDIIFEKEEGIATITLNRPERMNAYSPKMRFGIARAIEEAADDPEIRVLILTGAGDRGFCTGNDWVLQASQNPADAGLGERYRFSPLGWLAARVHRLDKPSIAAVNGVAAGGGFGLALSCDFRIASENARFGPVFIRRGLALDTGVAYFLPRLVGLPKALEICLSGDLLDAREAERIGLVNRVVPFDELMKEARSFAAKLTKQAPIAAQMTKRQIYRAQLLSLEETLEFETYLQQFCINSEDVKEGVAAFIEKRTPEFKGR
ncbi:MAG: enoyl-CoA hydratase [Dehalococcoidia bacterium]|nr:enoyl-CoA hydratase [Dehalococcoidia bacterium]